jgi:hypothetical protein
MLVQERTKENSGTENHMGKTIQVKCPGCGWVYDFDPDAKREKAAGTKVPSHRDGEEECIGAGLCHLLFSENRPLMRDVHKQKWIPGYRERERG